MSRAAVAELEVVDRHGVPVGRWTVGAPPPPRPVRDVRLRLPGRADPIVDVLGIPAGGLPRRLPVRVDLTLILDVVATGCPFGAASARLLVRSSGRITSDLWTEPEDAVVPSEGADHEPLAVEAPYGRLLDWLHGTTTFGNLLWLGCRAAGDWPAFSALAGICQARVRGPEADVLDALLALTAPVDAVERAGS